MGFKEEDAILKCLESNENITLKEIKQQTGITNTSLILDVWNDYRNAEMGYDPREFVVPDHMSKVVHYSDYEANENEGSELD
tara:strand:- start:347 stop:592 length:246 start_codon:yes stop_codon:yes gene_type:complete